MRFLIISLFIVSLSGCNSDDSSDTTIPDYNELNVQPIGQWKTSCISTTFDNIETELWGESTYTFTSTTVKNEWLYFSDNSCTTPYTGAENLWTGFEGDYKFLKHIESTAGLKANLYNFSWVSLDTPLSLDLGLHFEFEKMSYVLEEEGEYYITYTPTYFFVN